MIFSTSIGIKQTIRYEWMQYTVKLLKSGLDEQSIRKELEIYLSERKGSGLTGSRSECTMSLAVAILMNTWVSPKKNLLSYRDKILKFTDLQSCENICHWSMLSSAYPFWFNICYVFGSLFRLQDQVKKAQVMKRIYELLGERNTVERCSRYVIRSLVAWGLIRDMDTLGVYERGSALPVSDVTLLSLLFESALLAVTEHKIQFSSLINCPAFFNFDIPFVDGVQISKLNENIMLEQFSIDNEFLSLKR